VVLTGGFVARILELVDVNELAYFSIPKETSNPSRLGSLPNEILGRITALLPTLSHFALRLAS
jgi:hypothetical protein